MGCLFCAIRDGQSSAKIVHEDVESLAFEDVNPQAPVHLLVIPRKHLSSLNEATEADGALLGHLLLVAARLAKDRGIAARGWRTVVNSQREAGQSVFHVHLHLLGGRQMEWPPG